MKNRLLKIKAGVLFCAVLAFVFSIVCVDRYMSATASHTESLFMSCAGESDASSCTTTHQLLSNLVTVGLIFLVMLLSAICFQFIHTTFKLFSLNKKTFAHFLKIGRIPSRHNYLIQAFSSGIINPKIYQ